VRGLRTEGGEELKAFTYASGATPKGYECAECGASGVKLWRQWNTFACYIRLLCLPCACADQKKPLLDPTEDGKGLYTGEVKHWYRTADMKPDWWHGYDPEKETPEGPGLELSSTRERSSLIGSLAPAVPTEDGETYWGYSSVPDAGCSWWYALPARRLP
jgi:hypothetical protein